MRESRGLENLKPGGLLKRATAALRCTKRKVEAARIAEGPRWEEEMRLRRELATKQV